jgi:hypothetical protein
MMMMMMMMMMIVMRGRRQEQPHHRHHHLFIRFIRNSTHRLLPKETHSTAIVTNLGQRWDTGGQPDGKVNSTTPCRMLAR